MSRVNKDDLSLIDIFKSLVKDRRQFLRLVIILAISAVISIGLINLFFNLAEMIGSPKLVQLDDHFMKLIIDQRTDSRTSIMRAITSLGSAPAYFILVPVSALILFLRGRQWNLAIQASIILISASLLNTGLNNIYSRPRPLAHLHLVDVASYSYPSGHAMSAMVFYGFLVYLTVTFIRNRWLQILVIVLNTMLILAIGISRTYLGVHYPSDVLAGWAAGLCWLIICILILRLFHFVKGKNRSIIHPNTQN
jgi:membrane-associated phospholipid phosphatase